MRSLAFAAARALRVALASKVLPVSSGSSSPSSAAPIETIPNGSRSSRISRTLPGLWLATTISDPRPIFMGIRPSAADGFLLAHDKFADAFARELEQLGELLVAEGRALGSPLNLDKASGTSQHEIGIRLRG